MKLLIISEADRHLHESVHRLLDVRGVEHTRLTIGALRQTGHSRLVRNVRRYLLNGEVVTVIGEAVSKYEPDIIHIGTGRALALAVLAATEKMRSIPLLFDHGAIGGLNILNPVDHATYFNRRIAKIVVPSRAVINNWMGQKALRKLVSAERCEVLHHPMEVPRASDTAERQAIRAKLGLSPDQFVIGTACTIRPIKNLPFVASVVRECGGNAILVVVGPANDPAEVSRITAAGADHVRLVGLTPQAKDIMPAFDLYVTPTRAPGESFGLAAAEAMARGVPVITMNVGGTAEIVEHGISGFSLPASHADWCHTIQMLRSEPARRAEVGTAARARIKARFSADAIANDCVDLYTRVLTARSCRSTE